MTMERLTTGDFMLVSGLDPETAADVPQNGSRRLTHVAATILLLHVVANHRDLP
jgi:hypothetical protein